MVVAKYRSLLSHVCPLGRPQAGPMLTHRWHVCLSRPRKSSDSRLKVKQESLTSKWNHIASYRQASAGPVDLGYIPRMCLFSVIVFSISVLPSWCSDVLMFWCVDFCSSFWKRDLALSMTHCQNKGHFWFDLMAPYSLCRALRLTRPLCALVKCSAL